MGVNVGVEVAVGVGVGVPVGVPGGEIREIDTLTLFNSEEPASHDAYRVVVFGMFPGMLMVA